MKKEILRRSVAPYTNYTIQVLENIKGELITDKPIPIVKQGGISEKQDAIYLFENDSLPSEKSHLYLLAYAQEGWFVTNFWSKFKCNV